MLSSGAAAVPLRVGMLAPPWYDLPPSGYGGIEAMVYWLVQGLIERGHERTVISGGEDRTAARSHRTYPDAPSARVGQALPEVVHAAMASRHLSGLDLDVVHDHSLAGPLASAGRRAPTVVTAHGPVEDELGAYYRSLGSHTDLVAIWDAGGTPVMALRRGSVPEVVVDGVTGFVRGGVQELPEAIDRVGMLDPLACRRRAAERFDVGVMVDD
ncbi:MAG TPA: glycosyltransferase [Actinomycetes bacterium]|nr:glycosyltransferase [Actinomycetes bacterium]